MQPTGERKPPIKVKAEAKVEGKAPVPQWHLSAKAKEPWFDKRLESPYLLLVDTMISPEPTFALG